MKGWRAALRRRTWGCWEAQHDLAVCTGSPEDQPSPGLHPQQRGHRVRGRILPLCSTLLRPLGSPASSSGALSTGQSWSCGSGARGGPSNDTRAGTPLLRGKAGRAGAAQPWEEKAAGRPY